MRYTLRNQKKISKAHGSDILDRIIRSLDDHYEIYDNIKTEEVEDQNYPILIVSDIDHSINVIALYVIKQTFDVHTLAFKEFIG